MTYTLIAHQELTSSQASITFSSIPQTFTDLVLVISDRLSVGTSTFAASFVRFNGTTTNYTMRRLFGNGSSASSDSAAEIVYNGTSPAATANTFASTQIYIPNYTLSANKSVSIESVTEHNGTQVLMEVTAGLWANSAGITSISLDAIGGNHVSGASATLFGITAGTTPGVVVS